jgi:Txe/YoeB family toxin of toxin-antitoxin system
MYDIKFTKQAQKDYKYVVHSGLKDKFDTIIQTLVNNPYEETQGFEILQRELKGSCSRRINKQQRIVYEVQSNFDNICDNNGNPYKGVVKIVSMWTHYND